MDNENPEGRTRIPLDGTFGVGPTAELTIITKTEDGRQREETYTVPYLCLALDRIQHMSDINFILGYKIVKSDLKPSGLKELGL